MSGWTILGICCLVAAVAYWCGARVERHLASIDAARRGDDRFARRHRIDPDSYAGRGDWADEPAHITRSTSGRVLAYRRGRP